MPFKDYSKREQLILLSNGLCLAVLFVVDIVLVHSMAAGIRVWTRYRTDMFSDVTI